MDGVLIGTQAIGSLGPVFVRVWISTKLYSYSYYNTLLQRRCGWQGSIYRIPLLGRRNWPSYQVTVATMVSKKSGWPGYYKPKVSIFIHLIFFM